MQGSCNTIQHLFAASSVATHIQPMWFSLCRNNDRLFLESILDFWYSKARTHCSGTLMLDQQALSESSCVERRVHLEKVFTGLI